jgi:L-threonylcarbamoyladenylate synthase
MPQKSEITAAAAQLQKGLLVAMPTETVYGLAADATNEEAVKRIFAAKGRPSDHPLIVHVAKGDDLSRWTRDVPLAARTLVKHFWPGPLTLILKKSTRIPDFVTGGQDTVGLRCPAHPLAQSLLKAFDKIGSGIVAAPSANKFGHVSPTTAAHVRDEFADALGTDILVLDGGACEVGIESTIVDLSRGRPIVLRPGAITAEKIAKALGETPEVKQHYIADSDDAPRVSGALAAHYAPRTPLKLLTHDALTAELDTRLQNSERVAVLAFRAKPRVKPSPVGVGVRNARPLLWIQAPNEPQEFARNLYAHLRTLDAAGTKIILLESPPDTSDWDAINDRLARAAVGAAVVADTRNDKGEK